MTAPVPADQEEALRGPHTEIAGIFSTLIACSTLWAGRDDVHGVASAAMHDAALKLADSAAAIATLRAERDQLASELREAREERDVLRTLLRDVADEADIAAAPSDPRPSPAKGDDDHDA